MGFSSNNWGARFLARTTTDLEAFYLFCAKLTDPLDLPELRPHECHSPAIFRNSRSTRRFVVSRKQTIQRLDRERTKRSLRVHVP
jgi:hypothetical protein